MAGGHASIFLAYGKAMKSRRKDVMLQVHFGADYTSGEYGWTTNLEKMKRSVDWQLKNLQTDYIDFGFIHCLDAAKSPFHQALTTTQCIQYALDKPGVLTVLGDPGSVAELQQILSYCTASDEEKDYSVIGSFTPDDSVGKCVYCKHCHPCPAGLDIALINKYYDLSLQGDTLAKEHYLTIDKKASDCIKCGHCTSRCPFKVKQQERMEEIHTYFGE